MASLTLSWTCPKCKSHNTSSSSCMKCRCPRPTNVTKQCSVCTCANPRDAQCALCESMNKFNREFNDLEQNQQEMQATKKATKDKTNDSNGMGDLEQLASKDTLEHRTETASKSNTTKKRKRDEFEDPHEHKQTQPPLKKRKIATKCDPQQQKYVQWYKQYSQHIIVCNQEIERLKRDKDTNHTKDIKRKRKEIRKYTQYTNKFSLMQQKRTRKQKDETDEQAKERNLQILRKAHESIEKHKESIKPETIAKKAKDKRIKHGLRRQLQHQRKRQSDHQKPQIEQNDDDKTQNDEESEEEDQTYGKKRKHTKKNSNLTQQHINCEQRVKRWKQMDKLQQHLAQIGTWDFDVFYVVENAGNYAMPAIALTLFETKDLVNELKLNTTAICNFFHQISLEYKNNPYHNISHGCDVLVNCSYFLDAKLMRNIRTIDKFACLVAGATHDVGHPGNNNTYEINKESDFAVTYNDISVLESYHIALAWQVMKRPGCNILSSLDNKQRKEFRKLFIDSILNTDMSHHAEQQKLLAELIDAVTISGVDLDHLDPNELDDDVAPDEDNDKASETPSVYDNIAPNSIYADPVKFAKVVIPLMVHTADLSNPSKDLKLYGKWADRVVQEFFNQAENEKKFGLPVTSFMDKEQTDLPTIQTGFVNHVIRPWFDLWGRLLRDKKQGPLFQKNVNENLKFMQNELDKLKKGKENEVKEEEEDDYGAIKRRFKEQQPKQLPQEANNNNNRKEEEDDYGAIKRRFKEQQPKQLPQEANNNNNRKEEE
eukprot:1016796_1